GGADHPVRTYEVAVSPRLECHPKRLQELIRVHIRPIPSVKPDEFRGPVFIKDLIKSKWKRMRLWGPREPPGLVHRVECLEVSWKHRVLEILANLRSKLLKLVQKRAPYEFRVAKGLVRLTESNLWESDHIATRWCEAGL